MTSITGKPRRTAGVTLVEILVVLGVIVILASIAIVAGARLWGRGQQEGTRAILQGLSTALEAYAQDFQGWFPPDSGNYTEFNGEAGEDNLNLARALERADQLGWLESKFRQRDPVAVPGSFYILDAYLRPLRYESNSESWRLRSLGEDGATGTPTSEADDIIAREDIQ